MLHLRDDLRVKGSVVAEALGSSSRCGFAHLRTLYFSLERGVSGDGVQDAVSADGTLV